MHPEGFENLVEELARIGATTTLPPDWIILADLDVLCDLPTMAERRKWLKKARAELIRRRIQERVDEIAEAWECADSIMIEVLMDAFPKDLEVYKDTLSAAHLQKWIDRASLAASGHFNDGDENQSVIYFISTEQNQNLVKIGYTTNLESRLRSLRTGSPDELQIHLVVPGSREDERKLHRQFSSLRVRREWFKRDQAIDDFIARHRASGCQ
jgi:hypothetical protein